ncbi:coiled-coil domain-containing protein 137 isoform 2-T2 [Clarias gariepinus]|uniref:coiled-coil domain-containing protein 137 isoform X2 n=1 Tax=Clarias gariepinus TaxID=13013 RepID=UPI00234C822B|nr:coiled-coil domain-containing protein 137 isoform X2 [Clarias gariepinus]
MPTTVKDEEDHADREVVAKMVKDSRNKSSNFSHHQTEDRNPSKTLKRRDDVQPRLEEHLEKIPFRLRAIMKSREKMNMACSKQKKIIRAFKPKARTEICEQEHIRVPHFRRGKQESETAYLRRMSQETQYVSFLTKNQPERHPERHLGKKATTSTKQIKKKFNEERLLNVKKVKQPENVGKKAKFEDKVQFGEVALAPPSLTVKPKKAHVKSQRASSGVLLSSLCGPTDVSTSKCSMPRQKIIEEEHERVVNIYRQLKKQKLEQKKKQKTRINKFLHPQ